MSTQLARAIEQIQDKPAVPDIDFTQHKLEDGSFISTQERVIKDVSRGLAVVLLSLSLTLAKVQAPAMQVPTPEQFFANGGRDRSKPDIAFLKNHFYREGRLTEEQAIWIIDRATELLRREPNVLNVDAPITGTFQQSLLSQLAYLASQSAVTFMANMYVWTMRGMMPVLTYS